MYGLAGVGVWTCRGVCVDIAGVGMCGLAGVCVWTSCVVCVD